MFLAELHIENFRIFGEREQALVLPLKPGLTALVGENDTGILVLDTYFHEHHLATLKPWLLGQKAGGKKEGKRNLSRLKQHYVAMTRPTHLLCLAMREDVFTGEEIGQLKSMSWRVARVRDDAPEWL